MNEQLATAILQTVDAGLSKGMGEPTPGKMCVEAAVCFAMGLPHGDDPTCVGPAVRAYKIRLNDSDWSSPKARAAGMRRVALAQIGSDQIDQQAFIQEMALQTVKQLLPLALRAAAKAVPAHAERLERAAKNCEVVTEFGQARAAAKLARAAAATADTADAAADAAAAAYAAAAAAYAAAAYADAAYADAAAAYAADAADHTGKATAKRDGVLALAAEIAVQALIKLKSPGCEWLHLTESPA